MRRFSPWMVVSLFGWIMLWAWPPSARAVADEAAATSLRIGVLAHRGKEHALENWQKHAEYLTGRVGRSFTVVPLTLAEFRPAIESRSIDLLITNTGHYVELETGGKIARIATMRLAGPSGPVDRFGGTVIARAQRQDLQTYADLRGQRVLIPDRTGFGGWQVHLPEARAAGIDLTSDLRDIIEVQNHEQIVSGVLEGRADAGFVRSDLIESLIAKGKLDAGALRIVNPRKTPNYPHVHSTRLYPLWPFARLEHVSDELANRLLVALLELTPEHPAARAAGIYGWTLPHNYQPVHDLFLEFRLGPYADLPVSIGDVMNRYGQWVVVSASLIILSLLLALTGQVRTNRILHSARERQSLAAGVFEHAQEGIIITDAAGKIIEANDTFLGLTGYSRQEVIGRNPRMFTSGRQNKQFYRELWTTLGKQGYWRGEIINRRKDGGTFVQQTSITAVRGEDGEVSHFIGLSSDISELKESQVLLEHMAYYDALTSLPNRRLLSDRLHQAIGLAQRNEMLLAICYLDLDGFKPVNDTCGHAAGDRLLVEASRRLQSCVRGGDTVSRLGGDEFVVLLGNMTSLDECEIALERLRTALLAPFPLPEGEASLSASIGVTVYPFDSADADALIRHADQAMYASKQAGRNRFTLFDAEGDRLSEIKRESGQAILVGIEQNQFVLYYQPKVNMHSGEVIGAEALIRWQHPERGLLQPADFLPVVDFVGLQADLGACVLRLALQQMQVWQRQGLRLSVSVNVSAQQLQAMGFATHLAELLAEFPEVPPGKLELEILETAALDDLQQIAGVIDACHTLGVRFAIDDFGTGYSSLTYLKQLQAGTLKIDQSFVRDMLEDPDDLAIVDGIVGLATAFRREVIAEGVETAAHGRMLMQLGCAAAQGYGIARPMPAADLPVWAANWQPPESWRNVVIWPREDLPLLTVEIDHLRWVHQFLAALQADANPAIQWPQLDHAECRFGQWLIRNGRAKYGGLQAFETMAAAHAEVHRIGAAIQAEYLDDPDAARQRVAEIFACRDRLLARLADLRQAASLPAA